MAGLPKTLRPFLALLDDEWRTSFQIGSVSDWKQATSVGVSLRALVRRGLAEDKPGERNRTLWRLKRGPELAAFLAHELKRQGGRPALEARRVELAKDPEALADFSALELQAVEEALAELNYRGQRAALRHRLKKSLRQPGARLRPSALSSLGEDVGRLVALS